ncbi:hypothetical protein B0H11DRAFT_2188382 [Mycena galericulata]|nr:hypothetical protein B0H11DRAFT_2188382 [Mycena galericulata]
MSRGSANCYSFPPLLIMKKGFWDFVKMQWGAQVQQPVVKADLTGKTVVVLGANTGLGFEATKHFATMNPGRLILACRSQSRGQAAVEKLHAATGYAKAELWIIDLADFESVKQFATKFERDGGRLDILVENAGIGMKFDFEATNDGWESSIQVNHLATSLLAILLLPSMIKTAQQHSTLPRIVVVSSGTHYWATIEKPLVDSPEIVTIIGGAEYNKTKGVMRKRYPLTKLFNVFFVRALNARLPPSTPLIVDAADPGCSSRIYVAATTKSDLVSFRFCRSELRRDWTGLMAVFNWLNERLMALPTEVGSRQLVWAAVALQDHPEKLRGEFISCFQPTEVSDFALSPPGSKAQDLIWEDTLKILNKVDPRVNAIVAEYLSSPTNV